ncbi:MAG: UbiA prenyltransferase family protein [Elusimicrobiota bacterium]
MKIIDQVVEVFKLLRVHQYSKNLMIFLPTFFALRINEWNDMFRAAVAFITFSLAASAVYILNDIIDMPYDVMHPVKKNRPLAKGTISVPIAAAIAVVLLLLSMIMAWSMNVAGWILAYLVLNLAYTLRLKHIPILDIFIISTGFVIRIFVGGYATSTYLSHWIVIMTFLFAIFFAAAKRRDDVLILTEKGQKMREVVDGYNIKFLDALITIMASIVIVSYIMYTIAPETVAKVQTDKLYLTVFFVILGITRYLQLVLVENNSGSPTEVLLKDKFIQLSVLGWIITCGVLIYRIDLWIQNLL